MCDMSELGPHLTFELAGESWSFPLPQFHDTRIAGWGPDGIVGTFEQEPWPAQRVEEWKRRMGLHLRTARRWGWVKRLRVRVPVFRHLGWDEDGEDLGRGWEVSNLGQVLSQFLIRPEPLDRGQHLVHGNFVESLTLGEGVTGVVLSGNFIGGSGSGSLLTLLACGPS